MALALFVCGCSSSPPVSSSGESKALDGWRIEDDGQVLDLRTSVSSGFWSTDIEIEGPVDDQVAVRRMLFELRRGVEKSDVPPGPFGTTSERYNQHVFWDSDIWMFPALCFLDPAAARKIPAFRVRTMQAKGAPFFWETKADGSDGTPRSSLLHRSAPGSVAWMMRRASVLGLASSQEASKVNDRVRDYYRSVSLKGVRSIDEYAEKVDDELYTNLVANLSELRTPALTPVGGRAGLGGASGRQSGIRTTPQRATPSPTLPQPELGEGAGLRTQPLSPRRGEFRYPIPKDSRSLLNWKGDQARTYQQAAGALLAVWPLEHPEANPKIIADRFGPKINKAGPAMSEPILAIAYCRAKDPEKAYEHWRKGWRDFAGTRFFRFSETRAQRDNPIAGYFLTGAAGELNGILYGFLGLRVQSQKDPNAKWSMPLKRGAWLNATPQLPKKWKRVTVRSFRVLDQTLTLVAEGDSLRVEPTRP